MAADETFVPAWKFSTEMEVRDYELDAQAIVNNGVYFGYFEHCRHKYLLSKGFDFTALHAEGIDPIVVHADIEFKRSLRSMDAFVVNLDWREEGRFRLQFIQEIRLKSDNSLVASARITGAILRNGRPAPVEVFTSRLRDQAT